MTRWLPAYIGIGSNLGDPPTRVNAAFDAIAQIDRTRLVARSRRYRSRPFGPVQQNEFVNAVAGVLTQLSARELLDRLRAIEAAAGRVRAERWGPRVLDLDLLVFSDHMVDEDDLTVPHPGIAERGFVLAPLNDVAPELHVPGKGRVNELLARLPEDGIAGVLDQ